MFCTGDPIVVPPSVSNEGGGTKLFLDSNILLDIYKLSGPDLEELKKLAKLIESGKIQLLLPQQVVDEFWRNRESVIAEAMKIFGDSKLQLKAPNLIRSYPKATDLRAAVEQVNALHRELTDTARADIEANTLKADERLSELFGTTPASRVSEEIVCRAKRRRDAGNPPGKKGSLGDAINWEWMLEQDLSGDDRVVVISGDKDYESPLLLGKLHEYMVREWEAKNPNCELVLYKALTEFSKAEFPDIALADEVDKIAAIEALEEAWNFKATHQAIAHLGEYEDFKESEVVRLLRAMLDNTQVSWILDDYDVRSFAEKIMPLAKSDEGMELADKVREGIEGESETSAG